MKEKIDYETFLTLLDKEFSIPESVTWDKLINFLKNTQFSRDSRIQGNLTTYDSKPEEWESFDSVVTFNTTFTGETFQNYINFIPIN